MIYTYIYIYIIYIYIYIYTYCYYYYYYYYYYCCCGGRGARDGHPPEAPLSPGGLIVTLLYLIYIFA